MAEVINMAAQSRKQKLAQYRESRQQSVWDDPTDVVLNIAGLEALARPKPRAVVIPFPRQGQ